MQWPLVNFLVTLRQTFENKMQVTPDTYEFLININVQNEWLFYAIGNLKQMPQNDALWSEKCADC